MQHSSDTAVNSALKQAQHTIETASTRDRGRLLGLLGRWRRAPGDDAARVAFESRLRESVQRRDARAAQLPRATVDPILPIAGKAEDIVALIRAHQVVVVAGETGSGKTTQLPKLCLQAGRGAAGLIGCTQPRRIAARTVAKRVAEELQVPIGGAVGYQVRFSDNVSDATAIKFMTDGILLAEIGSDRWLSAYDTLIIDEAHERSLNIDFLLGYLKQLLDRRPDLKLIVTSATIDTARFAEHFSGAPVVDVEGRGFPVEVRYRPLEGEGEAARAGGPSVRSAAERPATDGRAGVPGADGATPWTAADQVGSGARSVLDGIVSVCDEIMQIRGAGDTLIFLPGEREIRDAHQALERRKYRHTEVLPLYARLSAKDQDRVFNPGPQRRIVLATNVAETSLTVPRIHYVVDPGLARVKRYSPRQKLDRLHIEPISQASADQRKGRCGRIAPGTCFRVFSEADFESRPHYTDPEIRRASLSGVILRMLSLGLGDIESFPFVEPPDPRAVADGWQQLAELGAIDTQRKLTATGRTMAKLPVDAKLARMLVAAREHGCLHEMLAITSFLGIQDPRERPSDQRGAADAAHAQFADSRSEFVGIVKLWDGYRQAAADLTQSQLRKWSERNFLGFLRMREWRELHRQLRLQCEELGWSAEPPTPAAPEADARALARAEAAAYTALHRALIAGLPTQIGHRADPGGGGRVSGQYEGPRGRRFQVFPGSPLSKKPPPWLLSATLLDTEKVWSLTNAAIEPDWVIHELDHLLARRHQDPRWSRAQGRVIGHEQISLFGLVLAPKKPVDYGRLYPDEARALFLRDGLVAGEINTRAGFVERNLRTLERAREEEAKQRRAGLVVDEDWMAQWYAQRLPADAISAQALDAWWRKAPEAAKQALQWSRDDLLVADGVDADLFPAFIALGDARLAVSYRFEPGAPDDGMTVSVPLHLLNAIDPVRLSWLAPGFVEDKAAALIRGLPKALRRNFVPAPDFARAFAQAWRDGDADAFTGTLARFLKKLAGVDIAAMDFDAYALDPHLRANLRLVDTGGDRKGATVLAESRDLDDLRARFGERAARAFAAHAADGLQQGGLTAFPETPVPVSIHGAGGLPAYPALQDDGDSVSLAVHADATHARRLHPQGVRRLLTIALADRARQARKQLPVQPKTALLYAAIESAAPRDGKPGDRLREDLVDGALAALLADGLEAIRDADAFTAHRDAVGKALFGEAMARLRQAEAILDVVAEIRDRLESKLMGWARANLDDMRAQLEALVPPGFLRTVPATALADYPRWLRALSLRAERAQRDPQRDQQRMLDVKPFVDALADAAARGRSAEPDWQALRWDIEELRVSLFAQELGAKGGVSPKKLASRVSALT